MTTSEVARFMASHYSTSRESVRILDPGAGTGVLTCALCEYLAGTNSSLKKIEAVAFEVSPILVPALKASLRHLKAFLATQEIELIYSIDSEDFVLSQSAALTESSPSLFPREQTEPFDVIISNPPYFKLTKRDPRAQVASIVVYGQPNIYGLFMAVSASLLRNHGKLIVIVPRSFASGPYFQRFREWFFERMLPQTIHVFNSRRDAFRRDDVLQENVILVAAHRRGWTTQGKQSREVVVSTSQGSSDLHTPSKSRIALSQILVQNGYGKVLRIPDATDSDAVREIVDSWSGSLAKYGLWISTGPVVPFRATDYLSTDGAIGSSHAPLLWMQHVGTMNVTWPLLNARKPQFILRDPAATKLLIKNDNYVLIRRFSAKEQHRRLTAAPLERGNLESDTLGLENHLNYLYRPHGTLSLDETWGLAALFNSFLLDAYFRSINGNTQVSATELRHMPLPTIDVVKKIGRLARTSLPEHNGVDEIVNSVLKNRRTHALRQKNHD